MMNNCECAWQRVDAQNMLLINKGGQTNFKNRDEVPIGRFFTLLLVNPLKRGL